MGLSAQEQIAIDTAAAQPMLAQVEAWSAVNSGSRNLVGLAQVAELLGEAFAILPGAVELVDPAPVDAMQSDGSLKPIEHGKHLLITVRPEAPVQLLFTGHMDTVYGADHAFQALTHRDDGTLNGPGVADMKGGLAILLAALVGVEKAGAPQLGYQVLINSDEEVGSPASAALVGRCAASKLAALTYEPAYLPDGTLAAARPGSGNFSFRIAGRSAHAGRNPEDGRNALLAAADLALRLAALRSPHLSVNPARIEGGSPNNVVPDHAVLRLNMRPRTVEEQDRASTALEQIQSAVAAEHDVTITRHGSFARPPKPFDDRSAALFDLVRRCGAELGQAITWKDSGGVCDGNNIAATGIPVVDTMGVRGGAIHSEQEYLIIESLPERAALSALTILRLANGENV